MKYFTFLSGVRYLQTFYDLIFNIIFGCILFFMLNRMVFCTQGNSSLFEHIQDSEKNVLLHRMTFDILLVEKFV